MSKKAKLFLMIFGLVITLCGCSQNMKISELKHYFGDAITNRIDSDTNSLARIAQIVRLDSEYSGKVNDLMLTNQALKNALLEKQISEVDSNGDGSLNVSAVVNGQTVNRQIQFNSAINMDMQSAAVGIVMTALRSLNGGKTDKIIAHCNDIAGSIRGWGLGLDEDIHDDAANYFTGDRELGESGRKVTFAGDSNAMVRLCQIMCVNAEDVSVKLFGREITSHTNFNGDQDFTPGTGIEIARALGVGRDWDGLNKNDVGIFLGKTSGSSVKHDNTDGYDKKLEEVWNKKVSDYGDNANYMVRSNSKAGDELVERHEKFALLLTEIMSLTSPIICNSSGVAELPSFEFVVTGADTTGKRITSSKDITVEIYYKNSTSGNNKPMITSTITVNAIYGLPKYSRPDAQQSLNILEDGDLDSVAKIINSMSNCRIYFFNSDVSSENLMTALKTGSIASFNNYFAKSGFKRQIIYNSNDLNATIDKNKLLDDDPEPIKLEFNAGNYSVPTYCGNIKMKSFDFTYINKFLGVDAGDLNPMYMYYRDTVEDEGRLYLLRYPVNRIASVKTNGDTYKFTTKETNMWVKFDLAASAIKLYNGNRGSMLSGNTSNIYLYGSYDVGGSRINSVENVPSTDRITNKSKVTANMLKESDVAIIKSVSGGDDIVSHFLLLDYLEGLYLPGYYPNGGLDSNPDGIDNKKSENVLALGRRIHIYKSVFDGSIDYNTVIGEIHSAVNNGSIASMSTSKVAIKDLVSASFGQEKVDMHVSSVILDTSSSNITYEFDTIYDTSKVDVQDALVEGNPAQIKQVVGKFADSAAQLYVYNPDRLSGSSSRYVNRAYNFTESDGTKHVVPYKVITASSNVSSTNVTALSSIKFELGYDNNWTSSGFLVTDMLNITPADIVSIDCPEEMVAVQYNNEGILSLEVQPKEEFNDSYECQIVLNIKDSSKARLHLKRIVIRLKYKANTARKIKSDGAPILLAKAGITAPEIGASGTYGNPLSNGTPNSIYSNVVYVRELKSTHTTDVSNILASEETPTASDMPQMFMMGVCFDVHSNDFYDWMQEENDSAHDGNLRMWMAALKNYGYINYPLANIANIDQALEQLGEIMERVYNFGSEDDIDNTIVFDPEVLEFVQEKIDKGILVNEAKVIRASAKIIGVIVAFIAFLWLLAWLIDAGTTGEGDGALYKITFKHMKTATGMSRKEAIELSTDGYKYITFGMLASRVGLLLVLAVLLILADPINIVSTVIGWVDSLYRLVREGIFNIKE